jgi:hypothetical protein
MDESCQELLFFASKGAFNANSVLSPADFAPRNNSGRSKNGDRTFPGGFRRDFNRARKN